MVLLQSLLVSSCLLEEDERQNIEDDPQVDGRVSLTAASGCWDVLAAGLETLVYA